MTQDPTAERPQILAVTADPTIGDGLSERIESDFRVTVEDTANAALATLDTTDDIQCIVSDHDLPDIDGIALLESVRVQHPDLPFIIFTSEGSEAVASRAIHARATDYLITEQFANQWERLAELIKQAIEYHRAQSTIIDREARVKDVLAALPDAIVIHRDDEVLYANQQASDLFDREDTADLVGRPLDAVFPALKSLPADRMAAVTAGESYIDRVEVELQGSTAPTHLDLITARITWNGAPAVLSIARDITARKTAKHAHRRSRQELEQILKNLPHAIVLHKPGGEILFVNTTAVTQTGYSREALLDMRPAELFLMDAPATYEELVERVQDATEPVQFEATVQTPDGEQLPVHVNSMAIPFEGERMILSVARDISDRLETEYSLRRLQRAVEAAGHAIYITDPDGTIEYVNPAFERITGYSADEAVGSNPRILKSGEMSEGYYEDLWATVLAGEVWEETLINQHKDGGFYYADQTIAPVTDDAGEVDAFVAIQTDITERKRLEDDLEETIRQLQVIDRVLRHNLHNDMNVVQGYAETIREASSGDITEYADSIVETGEKLLHTVDKEREITELLGNPEPTEPIDVAALVKATAADLSEQFSAAEISLEGPAEATGTATPKLDRAIEELVRNAIIHSDRDQPKVEVSITETAEGIELQVADDGPGIPEMEQDILTEEAEIEPLYHGSGLGLWLVHLIVKHSGGSLSFDANEPRGSIVIIELPSATGGVNKTDGGR